MHWTRPLDVLLLVGAWLLSPLLGFKSALLWWGVMISPVLHLAAILALVWAVRPFVGRQGIPYLILLFLGQLYIWIFFQAARPDHHSLLLLLFILSLGCMIRLLLQPFRPVLCYAAGAFSSLAMWVSVETLLPLFLNLAVLGLMWLASKGDFSRKNLYFSLALFCSLGVALLVERSWSGLTQVEFDSLSIIHWSIFGSISLVWLLIFLLDEHSHLTIGVLNRLFIISACVFFVTSVIYLICPKFFKGPFAGVDPHIFSIWLNKVNEMKPLIDTGGHFVPLAGLMLGQAIPALPYALYLMWRDRQGEYQRWLYICLGMVVFIPASLYQWRWAIYAEVMLIIPLAELITSTNCWARGFFAGYLRSLKQILTVTSLAACLFFLPFLLMLAIKDHGKNSLSMNVPLYRLCEYINQEGVLDKKPARILTHVFSGPGILYLTRNEVIATPYHRNAAGILDAYNIMTAASDEEARQLIRKRGIDVIILCLKTTESEIYSLTTPKSTFYQRLRQGTLPSWIKPKPLPPELSTSFKVFQVDLNLADE